MSLRWRERSPGLSPVHGFPCRPGRCCHTRWRRWSTSSRRCLACMRRTTRYLLWLYVFTVPWDSVSLPVVGSASRALGLAALAAAVMTTMVEGRFRKPDGVCLVAIAFAFWAALSLFWTISYEDTIGRVITYVQVVASVLMVRGFVRTTEEVQPLLVAICFGTFVPMVD